jgi:hypothetical protein
MDIRGFFGSKAPAAGKSAVGGTSIAPPAPAKRADDDVFEIVSDDSDSGGKQR